MSYLYSEILKRQSKPISPTPTAEKPRLPLLEGVRAVLFDVYGTLFTSGSGEVGTARPATCETAFAGALAAVRISTTLSPADGLELLVGRIEQLHMEARRKGIEHPEVDIIEVWRFVVGQLAGKGTDEHETAARVDLRQLAVEFEARANPVWPMPGLTDCLRQLRSRRLAMGIISNAQFYTRELFPALLGHRAEAWGFNPALQYYSYEYGLAKPGTEMFRMAADTLAARGIEPAEVLYIGNDMLHDVVPAVRLGFRPGLFAGDARSLRRRDGDPRVDGIEPEVVLTALSDLKVCFPR
ncbi:MAG: HAD family hydrolase [Pirellulales bacterium]|nr:HAD family hydrolase [Pirellulales bacterium]